MKKKRLIRFMGKTIITALFLVVLLTTGCNPKESAGKATEIPKAVVFAIDRSGSYNLTRQASNAVADLVDRTGKTGDIWFFRYIDDVSYTDRASIFTLELPFVKVSNNPFDPEAKRKRQHLEDAVSQLKKKATSKLRTLNPERAPLTDIYGAIIKASEIFQNYPNHRKFFIMATDFKDNLNHKGVVYLKGVTVIVMLFEVDKNPAITQERTKLWRSYLTENGAERVVVITPSEPLSLIEEVLK